METPLDFYDTNILLYTCSTAALRPPCYDVFRPGPRGGGVVGEAGRSWVARIACRVIKTDINYRRIVTYYIFMRAGARVFRLASRVLRRRRSRETFGRLPLFHHYAFGNRDVCAAGLDDDVHCCCRVILKYASGRREYSSRVNRRRRKGRSKYAARNSIER